MSDRPKCVCGANAILVVYNETKQCLVCWPCAKKIKLNKLKKELGLNGNV